jgi:pSer/pThr/pTyr-binding forkhead associated (FHA) protein
VAARPARAEPNRRQLFLRIVEPSAHEGQTFDLDDELTIGRSPGCGVPTPDDIYASTVHARLYRQKDQLWVEDLGSTNGTYVNSEKITQARRLGKGDVLQAGSTVFEVTR